jgi:hypothetical protein
LPEEYRGRFVENVRGLAVRTPDADFLSNEDIRAVFSSLEIDEILQDVKSKLLPNLDREIDNWLFNYDRSDDPESYFDLLIDALKTFSKEFNEDENIQVGINKALERIDREIKRLQEEREEDTERYEELSSAPSSSQEDDKSRSIFDDVDE